MTTVAMTLQPPISTMDSCDRIKSYILRGETDRAMNELQRLKADPKVSAEALKSQLTQVAAEVMGVVNSMRPQAYWMTGVSIKNRLHSVLSQTLRTH